MSKFTVVVEVKIQELKKKVLPLLKAGKMSEVVTLIKGEEKDALSTLQWIGDTPQERAETFAKACQVFIHLEDGSPRKAMSVIDRAGDDQKSLGLLSISQIVIKEVGLPEGGGIPSTINLCAELAKHGTKYALSKGSKKHAAMLNHNVAAFISPDFDENIPKNLLDLGEKAAETSLKLRREMGDPLGISWAEWMVGIFRLARKDGKAAIKHFSESSLMGSKIKDEKQKPVYVAWADLYHGKTLAKLYPEKKEKAIELMMNARSLLQKTEDDWSIGHAETMLKRYSR